MPTIDEMHSDMNEIERAVSLKVIDDALEAGCLISVNDGIETVVKTSANKEEIFEAMFSTGSDTLSFHKDERVRGWVWLIYGNGADLISDYSDNSFTNELLAPAIAFSETLAN